MTVQAVLAEAAERLRSAGVASPEHDAQALALHLLGLRKPSELALVRDLDRPAYEALVARRAARVPLQHLTGSVGFRWIDLLVGPGVFVPRPETEVVVQHVLDALRGVQAPLVVDLCAGSGAIALSVAHEVPGAQVHAVEIDPVALGWGRRNAEAREAAGDPPVEWLLATVDGCLAHLNGTVDVVVSNPPYVPSGVRAVAEPEVVDHDPPHAVFAGLDGLDVLRLVERAAHRLLRPGGLVVVEHDDTHGTAAPALFTDGWVEVTDHRDLTGRDRFLTARRAS